jgi:hypothetical protein
VGTGDSPGQVGLFRSAFQDDLRDGVLFGVGKRKRNMDCAELGRELGRLAVERYGGTASGLAAHFDVAPGDPMIPTRADGLHCSFFGGEARSVTLNAVGLRFTVEDLGLGEDPMQKAVAEARDGRFDARYFRYVDASADDHANSLVGEPFA